MSLVKYAEIDVIRELRLRNWARANYVSPAQRRDTWHPVVLDEMRRRDAELAELSGAQPACFRYVPLAPSTIRVLHPGHESFGEPNLLQMPQSAEALCEETRGLR